MCHLYVRGTYYTVRHLLSLLCSTQLCSVPCWRVTSLWWSPKVWQKSTLCPTSTLKTMSSVISRQFLWQPKVCTQACLSFPVSATHATCIVWSCQMFASGWIHCRDRVLSYSWTLFSLYCCMVHISTCSHLADILYCLHMCICTYGTSTYVHALMYI